MRNSASIAAATILGISTMMAAAPAKADSCIAIAPSAYEGYAPAYNSYRYNPYMWSGYTTNYSNFTPADCGYYQRRFFGAYVYHDRVRYVVRHYR